LYGGRLFTCRWQDTRMGHRRRPPAGTNGGGSTWQDSMTSRSR
jgi:hypothetical protein